MDPARIAMLAIAALGAGLLSACGGADSSSPEAVVESYFDAVADGDGERACSLGSTKFQRTAVGTVVGTPAEGATCAEAVAKVPEEARSLVEDVTVSERRQSEREATVEVEIEPDGAPPQRVAYRVVRDGEEWMLDGFAAAPSPSEEESEGST